MRAVFTITAAGLMLVFATLFCTDRTRADVGDTVSGEARQAFNAKDYAKALEKGEEALELARKSGNRQAIADSLSFLGGVYRDLAQNEMALAYFQDALAIDEEIRNRQAAAAALTEIGMVYAGIGRYEMVLGYFEKALAIDREIGDKNGVAADLAEIGIVRWGLGRNEEALSYFEEALAIDKELGNRRAMGTVLSEIGKVNLDMGRYERALSNFEESLEIQKEIGNRPAVGADLREIGTVYSRLGRYEQALSYLEEAVVTCQEVENRQASATVLREIGNVYRSLGQLEKALGYFEEALAIDKQIGDLQAVAVELREIGAVDSNQGRHEKALGNFEQALTIDKQIGNRQSAGEDLGEIGMVYWDLGRYEKALDYLQEELEILKEVGDRNRVGLELAAIGSLLSELGRYEKAYEVLEESLRFSTEIETPEILWRALYMIGKVSAELGKDSEAVSRYLKAIDTIETLRAGLSEKETKIIYMSGKIFVYDELIELYQKMHGQEPSKGYDRKALEIFERKQGRVFLEEMGKSGARHFSGLPAAVKDTETDLENRIEQARADIAAERSKDANQRDTVRFTALEAALQQIRADYRRLQEEIGAKYPDYYALKYPEPAGLKDIQDKVLSPHEFLLIYAVMKESSCVWVIGKERFASYPLAMGESELGQKVNSWRKNTESIMRTLTASRGSAENTEEMIETGMQTVSLEGQKLYELLIPKEVRETLSGVETLYIVPSGPLYGLPFEALVSRMDGKNPRYLVEDYPVAYLSSASLLKTLREAQARKTTKPRFPLLAFANPAYHKSQSQTPGATRGRSEVTGLRARAYLDLMGGVFLELPETEEEAREIKDVLLAPDSSTPLMLGQDASRSNVLEMSEEQKLTDYRYVVFSCHGVVPDVTNRVSQPALVLSQPDPHGGDGFLTMADTFGLRLNADLVTLSACNTGRGMDIRGEGVMGLTRAFMYAGTSAISVTLWSVESISAKMLTTGLYKNLRAGKGRAEALREIKLCMIHGKEDEMFRYPFFWAPLVLFGDSR